MLLRAGGQQRSTAATGKGGGCGAGPTEKYGPAQCQPLLAGNTVDPRWPDHCSKEAVSLDFM